MEKTFFIRYGHNYKVVLAIILPGLLTLPFILIMQKFPTLEEWKIWVIIFIFLGCIGTLSIWLAIRVYPPTMLTINKKVITLIFDRNKFLSPTDFSFNSDDISRLTRKEIGNTEFFIIETRNPRRKFQISPTSDNVEDYLLFDEAINDISEMVNNRT